VTRRPFIADALALASSGLPMRDAVRLARTFGKIHAAVPSPHYPSELVTVAQAIAERRGLPGDVAEFGVFKGSSAAKLSLACRAVAKRLLLFDSFEGLPEPEPDDVEHQIERPRRFAKGEYAGSLAEVQDAVRSLGAPEVCEYFVGWFQDTTSDFSTELAVAFIDVDLTASTREAIAAAWPNVVPGGILFVHDATDAKLGALLESDEFWSSAGGVPRTAFVPRYERGFHERTTQTLAWFYR
jgi:O-methyltransferase